MRVLQHLPIGLFLYLCLLSKYRADSDEPPCFIVSSARCAELKPGSKCELSKDKAQIFCCNVTEEQQLTKFIKYNVASRKYSQMLPVSTSTLHYVRTNLFMTLFIHKKRDRKCV